MRSWCSCWVHRESQGPGVQPGPTVSTSVFFLIESGFSLAIVDSFIEHLSCTSIATSVIYALVWMTPASIFGGLSQTVFGGLS